MALLYRRLDEVNPSANGAYREDIQNGPLPCGHSRVRVDGKFFARGGQRLWVRGVTYGPFAPDADGQPFPTPKEVAEDFARMRATGINSVRTYDVPPEWVLRLADESGLTILLGLPWADVPWRRHLFFLESRQIQREAREFVRRAARLGRNHPCILAYCIGNEIPPDILRWHGARRVERFLGELQDVAKQADPAGLVTYASYPPTEYLDLSAFDFATFNVYLHEREAFRHYLFRLQNLVGDKPLLLGELGMDTLRHGEMEQARFLAGHVREARMMGLAGTFVFSWTDDWHTNGHPIKDWAFGITHADRTPKVACRALQDVFERSPAALLEYRGSRMEDGGSKERGRCDPRSSILDPRAPRVSVVVCSYNGGRTLEQCLRSLLALDYPDYEVILVDDGSTDDTPVIAARFPSVRAIRQATNRGLSVARNVGLHAASGAIVAYTDSDCVADADWLALLVEQLQRSGAAAVGGPNLTPEDGQLAACVAACPGQPMHVLESDQVAEHIPGCNMAFRREALEAINGFDPEYRKAGDDVDVCWRLQQTGYWITFAPGAFVWHHRRQTPRAYLRQQAGYGEAEALLRFKHPDKFNGRGDGKWRGVLYGASLLGLRLTQPIVYRGTFSTGFFQCVYQPGPAHWAMLPATLEWHLAAALLGLAGIFWPVAWLGVAIMVGLSLGVAVLQTAQARLPPQHEGFKSRCIIAAMCYLQPLRRSWARYRTRLLSYRPPRADPQHLKGRRFRLPLSGRRAVVYWTEEGYERTELLGLVIAYLNEHRWGRVIDSGWSNWDLEVHCHPWTIVRICTAEQDHGGGKRLISVRYSLHPSGYTKIVAALAALSAAVAVGYSAWLPAAEAVLLLAACVGAWWRGTCRACQAMAVVDYLATELGLVRYEPSLPQQTCFDDSCSRATAATPLVDLEVIPVAAVEAVHPEPVVEPAQCPDEHRHGSLSPPAQGETATRVPAPAT
jgi:GT2 family glycosyltransferase